VNSIYQIFEIKLKPKEIDLENNLEEVKRLNWRSNEHFLVKEDNGLRYILNFSDFTLKCVVGELFLIDEKEWLPDNNPSREELVNEAIVELEKLPFKFKVAEILRLVRHIK